MKALSSKISLVLALSLLPMAQSFAGTASYQEQKDEVLIPELKGMILVSQNERMTALDFELDHGGVQLRGLNLSEDEAEALTNKLTKNFIGESLTLNKVQRSERENHPLLSQHRPARRSRPSA